MLGGALGAHLLQSRFEITGNAEHFDLATRFLFMHALALGMIALLHERRPTAGYHRVAAMIIVGGLLFCGSLIVSALTGMSSLVTPTGGSVLILAWLLFIITAFRDDSSVRIQDNG